MIPEANWAFPRPMGCFRDILRPTARHAASYRNRRRWALFHLTLRFVLGGKPDHLHHEDKSKESQKGYDQCQSREADADKIDPLERIRSAKPPHELLGNLAFGDQARVGGMNIDPVARIVSCLGQKQICKQHRPQTVQANRSNRFPGPSCPWHVPPGANRSTSVATVDSEFRQFQIATPRAGSRTTG